MGGDKVFVTGSATFEITDYSVVKKAIINGSSIQSDPFTVGGHKWVIKFYPQGFNAAHTDSASVLVKLLNPKEPVKAIFSHHLKDWCTSTWSVDTPKSYDVKTFSQSSSSSWGWYDFIKHDRLMTSSYLKDDTLVIKTTLWVVQD